MVCCWVQPALVHDSHPHWFLSHCPRRKILLNIRKTWNSPLCLNKMMMMMMQMKTTLCLRTIHYKVAAVPLEPSTMTKRFFYVMSFLFIFQNTYFGKKFTIFHDLRLHLKARIWCLTAKCLTFTWVLSNNNRSLVYISPYVSQIIFVRSTEKLSISNVTKGSNLRIMFMCRDIISASEIWLMFAPSKPFRQSLNKPGQFGAFLWPSIVPHDKNENVANVYRPGFCYFKGPEGF